MIEGVNNNGCQCRLVSYLLLWAICREKVVTGVSEQTPNSSYSAAMLRGNDQGAIAVVEETM